MCGTCLSLMPSMSVSSFLPELFGHRGGACDLALDEPPRAHLLGRQPYAKGESLAMSDALRVRVPCLAAPPVQRRRLRGKQAPPDAKRPRLPQIGGQSHVGGDTLAVTQAAASDVVALVDDASVDPAKELAEMFEAEVSQAVAQAPNSLRDVPLGGHFPCPLCPWYVLPCCLEEIHAHLSGDHGPRNRGVASGTKQLRIAMALYDADMSTGRLPGSYIARSAVVLRSSVDPPSSALYHMVVDDSVRVVLTGEGPRVMSCAKTISSSQLRRSGNMIYDLSFADALLRELCLHRGSLPLTMARMHTNFLLQGNPLASLTPTHAKTMWNIIGDILESSPFLSWEAALAEAAFRLREYHVLTIDGTMKVAMGLLGRRRPRGCPSPWPAEETMTRVLSIRGTTGFIVGLPLVRDEAAGSIQEGLMRVMSSDRYRESVEYVSVDRCTKELDTHLRAVLPNLKGVCLDPMHIVMRIKACTGNKRNPVSERLSKIMAKFSEPAHDETQGESWSWGGAPALTAADRAMREHVRQGDLPDCDMDKVNMDLSSRSPWASFLDFVRAMASLTRLFPTYMHRSAGKKGETVRSVLVAACVYSKYASYANNAFLRASLPRELAGMAATGTTGNEAFHNELRCALRQVYKVHTSTLALRLQVLGLSKRVAWDAARRIPGLRQERQHAILSRVLARPLLSADLWGQGQGSQGDTAHPRLRKATGSATALRKHQVAHHRLWLGAQKKRGAGRGHVKRVVFSQRRRSHLSGGGRGWGRGVR